MTLDQMLSPSDAARVLGLSDQTVIAWIRRGQLAAINVARPGAKRPRYLVRQHDLTQFVASRRVVARE